MHSKNMPTSGSAGAADAAADVDVAGKYLPNSKKKNRVVLILPTATTILAPWVCEVKETGQTAINVVLDVEEKVLKSLETVRQHWNSETAVIKPRSGGYLISSASPASARP